MDRKLHLNLFIHGRGHHESAWRHPASSPLALTDIRNYEALAIGAEAALFDAVFLADSLAIGEGLPFTTAGRLEPLTTIAALARVTERIGLIATASTTHSEPYNLARQFASLDHISDGRVGWNIVTSWVGAAAGNFGHDAQLEHGERYARAFEFLDVVTKLWDSWTDDAVLDDRISGRYAETSKVRSIDHHGEWYSVAGPLNIPRSPQGRPVFVQAGSSDTGRQFAATHAEVVFTAHQEKSAAIEFRKDLQKRAALLGRDERSIVVLPGISATLGSTESEAQRIERELNDLSEPSVGLARLSSRFGGYDFSGIGLDQVLSLSDFPDPKTVQAAQSRAETIVKLVEKERPTLRALLGKLAGARGHFSLTGAPEQIATAIEDWFLSGAADGFNIMPPILPAQFELFAEHVVPLLQDKGLFRREYEGRHLRDHLGLERPSSM